MSSSAGRVMIIPKGEYDSATTYNKYDAVSYAKSMWIAKATVKGVAPAEGTNWYLWFGLSEIAIDSSLSTTSTNPVQNKVITAEINKKVNTSDVINSLLSTETAKPLSAAQGKALNEAIASEATARYAADEFLYKSTLTAAGWTAGTGTNSATIYTQTVTPTKVNNGPNVTASMQFDNPRTKQTDVQATNETLMEVLNIVNAGYTVTNAAGTVTVNVFEKPTADIDIYWKGTVITS